jgi:hypothetical protein
MNEFRKSLGDQYFQLELPKDPDWTNVRKLAEQFKAIEDHVVKQSSDSWTIGDTDSFFLRRG